MKTVGFIGLGDSGEPVKNCAEAGNDVDAAFVLVLNGSQAKSVILGKNGLLDIMKPGSVIIVSATIGRKDIKDIEVDVKEKGIKMVDSGVSGGRNGADAGTLTLMVATERDVFEECQDLFNAIGENIHYVGKEIGMGQVVKSCLQALIGVTFEGVFETLALGAKAGVKPEVLYNVISTTGVGGPLFKSTTKFIMERKFKDTGSHIGTMYKDLGITMSLAKECGVPMFATSIAMEMFQAGISSFPDEDNWSVVKIFERITGAEVKKSE
jgi:3-hydroxyisobutyrate dehydrogenase-like beta-hydroxyacid dehydrogenase